MENPNKLFPLFVSEKLRETKDFYAQKLGFDVVIDMDGYLQVRSGHDPSAPELAFMSSGSMPNGPELGSFDGKGVIVSVPTPSADAKALALRQAGIAGVTEPEDRPWGWRSFYVADPNGILLDFFHVVKENPMTQDAPS